MQGKQAAHPHGKPEQNLRNLTNAIQVMFADMAAGYDRVELDPPQPNLYTEIQFSVLSFLHQFDIFYTLNQDTLIEQKCGPFIGAVLSVNSTVLA